MYRFYWITPRLGLGTLLAGLLAGSAGVQAQDSARALLPVVVRGVAPERFMAGLKVQRADSALTAAYSYQTLA